MGSTPSDPSNRTSGIRGPS
uniref:Uncharacterized protein n=1 Tax=Arundo donax TaxID=35708 RepID=A0A0A9GJT0_ARUDO